MRAMPDRTPFAGVRFACQGCGGCCRTRGRFGYVYVSLPERRRLARHLHLAVRTFTVRHCEKTDGFFHLRSRGRDCIFLDGRRCRVHRARPEQCRTWPFWPENLPPRVWRRDIAAHCPGVGRGPRIPARFIRDCLRREAARERRPESRPGRAAGWFSTETARFY